MLFVDELLNKFDEFALNICHAVFRISGGLTVYLPRPQQAASLAQFACVKSGGGPALVRIMRRRRAAS
jgi:hypothetical protein